MDGDVAARSRVPRLKIAVPELPPEAVWRSRLLNDLDRRPPPTVTLVCAPAGSGKTLVLAQWARRHGRPVAWVSLDTDDDNDRRFWSAVLDALGSCLPEEHPIQRVTVPTGPSDRPEFLAEVVDRLGDLPDPVALVLDDLHELTRPEPWRGVRALLRHRPPGLRLVLSTRATPPLPVARLRLADDLAEIDAHDLRFTAAEARELVATTGLDLSAAQLTTLLERTEGWAVGLRLALMSLRQGEDVDRFLTAFAANDQSIGDYLAGEVLSRMTEPDRDLLRAVSVCDEVTPQLAIALSGREDAGAWLAALEQRASLAVRTGGDDDQYRIHSMVRTHALADLRLRDPEFAARLHGRAADWFAGRGEPVPALAHACEAKDQDRLAGLLRQHATAAVLAGHHDVIRRALAALSPGRVAEDCLFALVSAYLHLEAGEPAPAEVALGHAAAMLPARPGPELAALVRLVHVRLAQLTGDLDEMVRVSSGTAAEVPPAPLDALGLLQRGNGLLVEGDHDGAVEAVEAALRAARAGGYDYVATQCLTMLSGLAGARGEFRPMTELAAKAVADHAAGGWERNMEAIGALSLLGYGALLRADAQGCLRHTTAAASMAEEAPEVGHAMRFFNDTVRGVAEFELGERLNGMRRVRSAREAVRTLRLPDQMTMVCAFLEHRLALQLNWNETAGQALRRSQAAMPDSGEVALMRARAQIAFGRHGVAVGLLRPVLLGELPLVLPWSPLWAELADAEIQLHAGERRRAHRAMARALALAEPHSVLYPLVFAPEPLIDLLVSGLGRFGTVDGFAGHVVAVRRSSRLPPAPAPLTERERAVLGLLPTALSFEEIADDLMVSPNTVKTHVQAIYHKLGVSKRRSAVDAAREQGLLEDVPPLVG